MKDVNANETYDTWLSKHGGYANSMTLRDYFAAKAMNALITRIAMSGVEMTERAYCIADAMLKAREQ